MGSYIALEIELQAIRDFLNKTLESVDAEVAIICKREEAGEFQELEAFGNALFIPEQREAIAIRAVLYELNALIEWSLYDLALEAYANSPQYAKIPKSLVDVPPNKVSSIKFIHELPFREVCRLIEQYHEVNFSDVPSFARVESLRKVVNAFKHRKGFKDFRKDSLLSNNLLEKYEITREEAFQAINGVRTFIRALWGKTKRSKIFQPPTVDSE